ncbi:UNVERIFIED_CONTAM: hypothetical protein GTU68_052533 [Idotea baltica]|nr:hypothetical protein [Idotea baltica]
MRVILLGPPGAGKGTQAINLANKLGVPHISTGEIMRKAVADKTDLGIKIKEVLDSGQLVSDATVLELVVNRVSREDCSEGYILDGFPRTLKQAQDLSAYFDQNNLEFKVLELQVAENILIDRIKARANESTVVRSDDNVEVATKRLQVYWEQTAPVSNYYRKTLNVIEVDGLGTIEEVKENIFKVLNLS